MPRCGVAHRPSFILAEEFLGPHKGVWTNSKLRPSLPQSTLLTVHFMSTFGCFGFLLGTMLMVFNFDRMQIHPSLALFSQVLSLGICVGLRSQ